MSDNTAGDQAASELDAFCGYPLDIFANFVYNGEETTNGILTEKFTGIVDDEWDELDMQFEFWVDSSGKLRKKVVTMLDSGGYFDVTYSGWNEPNLVAAPQGVAQQTPMSTPTPTPEPTATPTPEPTNTPTPAPADAWLEPDPTNITFDGQWRPFTVRGTGLAEVNVLVNVVGRHETGSSGAVEITSSIPLPSATSACETTYYSGRAMAVDGNFNLVGCQAGTVLIHLADGFTVLREYTVAVSAGP